MPRYFSSLVTGRPVEAGGRSFVFEPVEPMGGSWVGVLAVDDESAASILAAAGLEISEAAYNQLKKKVTERTAPGYVPLQKPQPPPLPLVGPAAPVAAPTASASESGTPATVEPEEVPLASLTLVTTSKEPPHEPLLEAEGNRKRRKAA